jgi:hypothetical protein
MWPKPCSVQRRYRSLLVHRLVHADRQHAEVGQALGQDPHAGLVHVVEGHARAYRVDAACWARNTMS